MEEQLEHVVFCDAQKTNHAAVDRFLEPEQLEARRLGAEAVLAQQVLDERRAAAMRRLQLRSIMCHPEPLTTRDLADLLLALGGT